MGCMPLHDDAIQLLLQIKSLEYVEIHGLEITDRGIQVLSDLTALKRIYIDGCRNVTTEGVNKLISNLKGDYVLDYGPCLTRA